MSHQIGSISSTFTSDWYLRKGESRDKMGEWMKKATVRSQDQRRMIQANTHSFPSNYWRNKITKGKESDKCDLCRVLWITEGRFNTEDELPIQTLGHIQHQCETLSEAHTLDTPPKRTKSRKSLTSTQYKPLRILSRNRQDTIPHRSRREKT